MDAWPRCLERLEAEFPAEDVHTWLKPLQAEQRSNAMVLYAPNAFIVEQVRERTSAVSANCWTTSPATVTCRWKSALAASRWTQ